MISILIFINLPAMHAFMKELKLPANIALAAYFRTTLDRDGASTESRAISMPIEPKFAKPQIE
jgi:uncharacterized protein YqcC (DUF446 family)